MSQATLRDLCAEAINVDGTGDATFHGALRGHRTFAVAYAGALPLSGVRIKIEEANSQGYIVRWEDSECTVSETGFTRDTCVNSSNNGAFVEFGAGYKRAFVFIPVADVGGSGAVTSVAGRTGAVTLSAADVSGLGTAATTAASAYATAAQGTDDRTASGLRTATTVVSVSAATAPSAGQTLVATSSTAATWQTPAGGISAADLAGGTLPASLTTLATSGVATLGGLTVSSPTYPQYSITYEDNAAALTFRYNSQPRAQYSFYGINLFADAAITWSSTTYNHAVDRDLQVARNGGNRMGIGSAGVWNDAALELGAVRKKPYTVGTLPVAPSAYDQCLVVDALAPAIGSAVVGGGGVAANVIWISPNWMVI